MAGRRSSACPSAPRPSPRRCAGVCWNERMGSVDRRQFLVGTAGGAILLRLPAEPARLSKRALRELRTAVRGRVTVPAGSARLGYCTTGDGIVLDLSRLRGIRVSSGRATVGPGAELIDVQRALTRRGLSVPAGSCPTVGIGGLAARGGARPPRGPFRVPPAHPPA